MLGRLAACWLGAVVLAVGLSGCSAQLGEFREQLREDFGGEGGLLSRFIGSGEPEAEPEPAEVEDVRSLSAILDDLQRGQYDEGEASLRRYLEKHPDDNAARAVLRQLTEDPEAMLGRQSHRYVVQRGDSWSALATRILGDPGLFLVLARYNDSSNPSDLRVGQVVRLPGPPPSDGPDERKDDDGLGEPAMTDLPEAPVPSRRTVDVLSLPAERLPSVDAPARPAEPQVSDRERAERLQREAVELLEASREEAALSRFRAALALEPGLEPAASRAVALRDRLVTRYHERAIVLYRNQDLDEAIALWDRVLAIDPDFEPARSYRARARELRRRVDSL